MAFKPIIRRWSRIKTGNGIVHTFGNKRRIWSSARTLKRMLKCNNERNPYSALQVSRKTAWDNQEEGGDDAKSAWPFDALGCTRGTMESTMGLRSGNAELISSKPVSVRIGVCNSTP